ncbi:MAG: protein-disulfide reductase DsbD family protein [Alphaproteobacteria bacterium]
MMLRLILLLTLLIGFLPVEASAADRHISVSVAARVADPRPGTTTRIAITLTPQHGWHAYWRNPGDSGLPPEATWTLPEGATIGALEHPAPTLLELGGLASYVHEGAFTLLADLRIAQSVSPGTRLPVRGSLSWLACSDSLCVPESAEISLDLVAGKASTAEGSAPLFKRAEAALPAKIPASTRVALAGDRWEFLIDTPIRFDPSTARLYPDDAGWFGAGASQQVGRSNDRIRVSVAAIGKAPDTSFSGLLSDGRYSVGVKGPVVVPAVAPVPAQDRPVAMKSAAEDNRRSTVAQPPAGAAPTPNTRTSSGDAPAIRVALVGALLGGLLLNLMPCVFPILSLKALSLARSGSDRRAARIEGTAYAAGSILAIIALGGVLLVARAMGQDIGWSFQLQDPRAILVLLVLTLAIALNLAGVFEVRGPSFSGKWLARGDWQGAFGTGALAAVIATPCSGPFMGVALGAALVLPAPAALAVFAGLGLGMALPFLLIAFIPALQRVLPRPGAWMETFRRLLAIPMLLTAIALAWVLGRQSGVDGMAIGLIVAMLAAMGLWWVGVRQHSGKRAFIAVIPVAAAILAALIVELPATPASATTASSATTEPFSEARLASLRAEGTPVFVDMTADWCLICQVNERVAIDRPATRDAFAKAGVVTLVGDWTRGDPAITRFLKANGRNSIPYYLFTDAAGRTAELPQVLTTDLLIDHASGG